MDFGSVKNEVKPSIGSTELSKARVSLTHAIRNSMSAEVVRQMQVNLRALREVKGFVVEQVSKTSGS